MKKLNRPNSKENYDPFASVAAEAERVKIVEDLLRFANKDKYIDPLKQERPRDWVPKTKHETEVAVKKVRKRKR